MKIKDVVDPNISNKVNKSWLYINYLDTGNCTKNIISGIQYIKKGKYPLRAKRVVKKNDVIISTVRPNQYHLGVLRAPYKNMVVSTGFLVLRPKNKINPEYLYYYLLQDHIIHKLDIIANNSTSSYPSITPDDILNLEIALHKRDEQENIAAILSSLDDKINLNNKTCSELKSLAQDLYHYWFTQFDFPDEKCNPYRSSGGKMVWNDELGREIPEGWEVHRLVEIAPILLGGTPDTKITSYWKNGTINWLSSGEIVNFPVLSADAKISQEAIDNSATVLLRTGSVALSITRYIRPTILGIDACINQSVVGIEESPIYKHSFLYPFIESQVSKYMGLRTGAMQPHINKAMVEDTPIICPPDRVLHEYYKTADPLFAQIMTIARESFELAQLRDFLLPLLMNGQVSVSK